MHASGGDATRAALGERRRDARALPAADDLDELVAAAGSNCRRRRRARSPARRGSAASSAFEAQVRLGLQRDDLLDGRRVVAEVDPVAGTELQRAP
jgi:hypothetical protein